MNVTPLPGKARFGPFELDPAAGELYKRGRKVRIPEQAFQILSLLVEHPEEIVTREEIRRQLWPNGTLVEFEHSINAAIKKLRLALGDSAEAPRYIETLPRRGYRLIVSVERLQSPSARVRGSAQASPIEPSRGNLTGRRISHYRVLSVIGGGAMGLVYQAEDLKLGRRVALKFLPEELTKEPLAIKRLRREACAASVLNHPNICTVHAIEEESGRTFIVMELLEGCTLRDRIARAPFNVEEISDIGIQISDALQAAHQQGIIHRDIKPANIFISDRQQLKILDFGVAKRYSGGPDLPESLSSDIRPIGEQPLDPGLTKTGATIGTAAYMSPEQVRGEDLDCRTDLFSFGLVLYEMATSRRAFEEPTISLLHDAILHRSPKPVIEVNERAPAALVQIIDRAIQKDRSSRYQSAAEVRDDLARLLNHGAQTRNVAVGTADASPSKQNTLRRRITAMGVLSALAAAGVGLLYWRSSASRREFPSDWVERQLTFNSSVTTIASSAISNDGKYLAYSDQTGIHVRLLSTGEEQLIPKAPGVPISVFPIVDSWFPDRTQLLVHSTESGEHEKLWTVSVMGQSRRELRSDAVGWEVSPNGTRIAFSPVGGSKQEIWVMDSQGENPQKVLGLAANERLCSVRWSPDNQRLAYVREGKNGQWTETCDLRGANRTTLVASSNLDPRVVDLCWLSDGRIVYTLREDPVFSNFNLWQIEVDTHSGRPISKPKRITHNNLAVRNSTNGTGFYLWGLSASADGKRLVFRKEVGRGQIYLGELAAGGRKMSPVRRLADDEADNQPSAWTADSRCVLFTSNRTGEWGIFKHAIMRRTVEPLVMGRGVLELPRLSPNGAWVIYKETLAAAAGLQYRIMRVSTNGGLPQPVFEAEKDFGDFRCSGPLANVCVLVTASEDPNRVTLTAFDPMKGKGKPLRDIEESGNFADGLSPDGSTFATAKRGEAETHIKLFSLSGRPDRQMTLRGRQNLAGLDWSANGQGLFCGLVPDEGGTLLYVELNGATHVLWQSKEITSNAFLAGIPSPDGRYLAIWADLDDINVWMLEGF